MTNDIEFVLVVRPEWKGIQFAKCTKCGGFAAYSKIGNKKQCKNHLVACFKCKYGFIRREAIYG
ncbi:hypothetical protein A3D00_03160 [Candidatus Woesebacteria bacterium RIFCSPHIGHO2_02_FULL_38_9]|uniref:Uncharacterized protein n=1 Tax=Candidatus Woesebacteria bacterium RIFCSPHIGHO2_01_FULL_39_28 TaxID=1802496 RepID=A0A1F7YHN5_9BACT|nr:MAG: hypothetical protein A2627_05605 [Candidatus Woesebacteria bacterium RIFCSPHIGHO2_01_FULL_39_28]OGM31470.1 MAG: hypothetical protein A3D00_03160 [Candidatus Woesebacteria bacterium RIFCSPHIGHO2_02_FULL_38_9]OGM56654.1 MAG: hypothetical protein A3A50_04800 [Candidatus Woesebacteria bacterium RIFCSPLOWO2_01_FULL_38_20]